MRTREVPNALFVQAVEKELREGRTVTFRVKGNSMRPFLSDGRDQVILAPLERSVRRGDVVLAEVMPGRFALHRVVEVRGETITMRGDGNPRGVETFEEKDVVGIARGFLRKGRTRPDLVTGRKWRLYSWLWMRLLPLRYVLIGIDRRWLR